MSFKIVVTLIDDKKDGGTLQFGDGGETCFEYGSLDRHNEIVERAKLGNMQPDFEMGRTKMCLKMWNGAENYEDIPERRIEGPIL